MATFRRHHAGLTSPKGEEDMSSYLEGQTHQLANAFEAGGLTAGHLTKLGQSPSTIEGLRMVLDGEAKITLIKRVEPPAVLSAPVEKFGLLADLGIVVVPDDYVHELKFQGLDFSNPTRVLKPGDRLWVRAHKQVVSGTTTSEERLTFLASLNSHLTGAQGVRLVRGDKKAWPKVPKGYWYASFDEKERLPLDAERNHRVPEVDTRWSGGGFNLGYFEIVWNDSSAILSFCDVPSEA